MSDARKVTLKKREYRAAARVAAQMQAMRDTIRTQSEELARKHAEIVSLRRRLLEITRKLAEQEVAKSATSR